MMAQRVVRRRRRAALILDAQDRDDDEKHKKRNVEGVARFLEIATYEQNRPALAFLGAQTINVFWTLLQAWLLFGGMIVAQPIIN
jgi:hypothetical protein